MSEMFKQYYVEVRDPKTGKVLTSKNKPCSHAEALMFADLWLESGFDIAVVPVAGRLEQKVVYG